MTKILLTGATGNVGLEVIHYLNELKPGAEFIVAAKNLDRTKKKLQFCQRITCREFDFRNKAPFPSAFNGIDILFLLRPPDISDIENVFQPLLKSARKSGINKIVFLSVQGAEKSKIIPHNKIERLVKRLGFDYIFVRPSYFMQNLTSILLPEILNRKSITLPSGRAQFNWIDVKNIGEIIAIFLLKFEKYKNQAFEITGTENRNFEDVAGLLTQATGKLIRFKNINPLSFYFQKKKEGVKSGYALVMTILHFLPRIEGNPRISENYQKLTGKEPTTLIEFIEREKEKFLLTSNE